MKLRTPFCFLLVFLSIQISEAQDAFFSQFQYSPITLNSAITGTDCGHRFALNYRNQWPQLLGSNSYHTISASYDTPIVLKNGDRMGLGGQVLVEKAGASQLMNSKLNFSFSYQKSMLKSSEHQHYLIGGMQFGLAHRILVDFDNLRWGSQHDGNGGFDPTITPNEDVRDRYFYPDLSAGLAWQTTFSNENSVLFGFSAQHLNRPNQSFLVSGNDKLQIRYVIHGMADFKVASKFSLLPRFVFYSQGPSFHGDIGTGFKFHFNDVDDASQKALELGAGIRLANNFRKETKLTSIITSISYEFDRFVFGLSMDIDQSAIQVASNGFGALEVLAVYKLCK